MTTASQHHPVPHQHRCPTFGFPGGKRFLHKSHTWTCWRPKCTDPLGKYACGLIADALGSAIPEVIDSCKYLSIPDAARIAGYSVRQMTRITKKELDPFTSGTRYFILKAKFEEWLAKRGIQHESQSA